MTRRAIVRTAALAMFGMALGRYDALAQDGGFLTIDLNQWQGLKFRYKGETLHIPVAEVFAALKEGPQ
jgi:hypothetical protein